MILYRRNTRFREESCLRTAQSASASLTYFLQNAWLPGFLFLYRKCGVSSALQLCGLTCLTLTIKLHQEIHDESLIAMIIAVELVLVTVILAKLADCDIKGQDTL